MMRRKAEAQRTRTLGVVILCLLTSSCELQKEPMWQLTPTNLIESNLLIPSASGGLPTMAQVDTFFRRVRAIAGNAAAVANPQVENLVLEIDSDTRWLKAIFDFDFDGQQWIFAGQVVSPDALVNFGGIDFLPRTVTGAAIGPGDLNEESVKRAYDALKAALQNIARQAAEDVGLEEFKPTVIGT